MSVHRGQRAWGASTHLIVLALTVAAPLLMLVGLLLYRSVTLERQQLERRVVQVMEAVVADVDRDIERQLTILQTLATSPAIAAEDWRGLYAQAKSGLRQTTYLVLVDAEGRQLVNTFVPYGEAPARTGDPATLERMRRTGHPIVSELFTSLVVKQPVYNVSIPVMRDRELGYVMSLGLLPTELFALLRDQRSSTSLATAIFDANGAIMASSRDATKWVGTQAPAGWRSQMPGQVADGLTLTNAPALVVTGRSILSDWTVAVTFPIDLASRELQKSMWLWGVTITAATLLAIALAYVFGRQLTRPLASATAAADALGRGEAIEVQDSRLTEANAVNQALRDAQARLQRSSAALLTNEEQLREAADAAQFGAHQYDVANDHTIRSPQFRRIVGAGDVADATFESGLAFVHPDDRDEVRKRKQQILAADDRYQFTYRVRRPDGEVRWVMDRGQVIRDSAGAASRVVGVLLDVTDLKSAEQRQRLLFDELNHRVKNTLAIVQSLAQQTLRTKPEPAEFARAFEDRLASLARAHNLLTRESWNGAPLATIVTSALEPFIDERGRIAIDGPPVAVPAGSTITLCLMLHELATNAAKYGALAGDGGRVSIAWTVETNGAACLVDLQWREDGGQPIVAPARKGFGSRLLAASALQLNGELAMDFAHDGLRFRLRFTVPADAGVAPS